MRGSRPSLSAPSTRVSAPQSERAGKGGIQRGPEELSHTRSSGAALAGIALIWGLGPPIMKLITAPALVSASVRLWLSIPLVWAATYLSGQRMTRDLLMRTALPGALFGLNLTCVFAALQHTSVAVVSVVLALQPAVVLVAAGMWLDERVTLRHASWTATGVGGVIVVVLGGDPEVTGDARGLVLALAGMLAFAAYYLLNRRSRSTTAMRPLQWMAGTTLSAAITVTPLALWASTADDYRELAGLDWLYLAYVAVLAGLVAHTMMSWVHRFVVAGTSSLTLLSMNVIAVAAAWPINSEPVTLLQTVGGLIVLIAIAAVMRSPAEHARTTPSEHEKAPTLGV